MKECKLQIIWFLVFRHRQNSGGLEIPSVRKEVAGRVGVIIIVIVFVIIIVNVNVIVIEIPSV